MKGISNASLVSPADRCRVLDHPKLSQDGIYPVGRDSVAGKCRGAEFSERKGDWRRRRGKINMLTRRGPDLCLDGLMAVYWEDSGIKSNKSL